MVEEAVVEEEVVEEEEVPHRKSAEMTKKLKPDHLKKENIIRKR